MIVVAYYTNDRYEDDAKLLAASCDRVKMQHSIQRIPDVPIEGRFSSPVDQWDWNTATAYKPKFLFDALHEFDSERSILYVDVDAFFHENCNEYFVALEQSPFYVAMHWLQPGRYRYHRMLTGTLWLQNVQDMLRGWININHAKYTRGDPTGGGQRNLYELIESGPSIEMFNLPGQYCYVFNRPECYPPGTQPIIEHTIASRENRDQSLGKVNEPRQKRKQELWGLVRK
jgi:hypothetical protein